ncbi:MAG: hypothetical protein HQL22_10735 [Candidatus Omnitrophica bacterium]|nr:hypothetical protein [Candidatus Omnitrophota bacterium]
MYPKSYLEKTINLFQPFSATPLTLEDAREIADNTLGLYEYALELKQKREGGCPEPQQPDGRP